MLLIIRADLEIGRGDFDAARAHLEAARATLREDRALGASTTSTVAELALWERRWTDADEAVRDGLARRAPREAAQIRVWLCAKGLRAQAELAALARARRDADAVRDWLDRARKLHRRRPPRRRRGLGDHAERRRLAAPLAEAEYERARGDRAARAVVGGRGRLGAARAPAARGLLPLAPGRGARRRRRVPHRGERAAAGRRTPSRLGSERQPLLRELELLAQRARLDLAPPDAGAGRRDAAAWRRSSA